LSGDERFGAQVHHRDVVGVALRRMERDLEGPDRQEVLTDLARELRTAEAATAEQRGEVAPHPPAPSEGES